ncbi:NmrA family NAD(P)-binding protein [Niveispirillum sp.]|uniref:NmrA family NAD(P)-binding protein n=1 Tax=Niveispirillum sp. TaxID=1917217 RepID=UPI001B559F39|nr:NmrA family NAD(P)-binding protein [Niveispirillum sp.]MBP7335493.1 NmrA family NAD(P)-binding protein [Niveispirillum sp.]
MRIAVVGATGRIGAKLTRTLLSAGHQVKALSRGGAALDALVKSGAEPVLGSFDTGTGALNTIFQDVEAAFLMVKTDWSNPHGHYPAVARRFVEALSTSSVKLAVSLTAIGSEVKGETGHFEGFYHLDEALNQLENIDLVHLRAGWFMENLLAWTGAVARHGAIGWSLNPDLKTPWVAIQDIAQLAANELNNPTGEHRVIREVGSSDLTMPEIAAIMSREIDRPVEYRFIDRNRECIQAEYLKRFGALENWLDDNNTLAALNDRVVRFHGARAPLPTTMDAFIRDTWKPAYLKSLANKDEPETFYTWSSASGR